jgi:protein-disulfide isomerase
VTILIVAQIGLPILTPLKSVMKKFYLIIILVAIIALAFWVFKKNSTNANVSTPLNDEEEVSGWAKGDTDSNVKLVEYSDFQCPACRYYYSLVKELNDKFAGKIYFEYRYFPLKQIHPNTMISSQAAEAAGLQNKFWEMYDKLFENQKDWSNMNKTEFEQVLAGYAEEIRLDVEKFKTDLVSKEVTNKVEASYNFAIKNKINSTPTFFLNGNKINNPRTLDEFSKIIQDKLDASLLLNQS